MARVCVENLTKTFKKKVCALRNVSLELADGERVALLGPPGSGKTTLVRMIAGLEEIPQGRILLGEQEITNLPPAQRDVATTFHNYALYPHLTVYRNLGYGLRLRGLARDELDRRVRQAAQCLRVADVLDRKPDSLSGDQRQRVALGRALVAKPTLWLLDEPFLDLDPQLRRAMQAEIVRLHEIFSCTLLFVTRDLAEAQAVAQRIIVLRHGEVQQTAPATGLRDLPIPPEETNCRGGSIGQDRLIIPGRTPRRAV